MTQQQQGVQAQQVPIFQRIKDFILAEIQAGRWKEGDVIPTEAALAQQFAVSRMTVNRAVRELSSQQVLHRIQGSGTYVAPQKYQATLVEIKSIAEEIRARGHRHRSELHKLERCKAGEALALQFRLPAGQMLFHSVIVHFENEIPIQVEDRWVNPALAPDYMLQDFASVTPNEYLMRAAPLQGARYGIEALGAPKDIAEMLAIGVNEPCLVLQRSTESGNCIASVATLWHPGARYRFAGSFC